MFINKRKINGKEYTYVDHSYRIGSKVKKVILYSPKKEESYINKFIIINSKAIDKIVDDRIIFFKKKYKINKFFLYGDVLEKIEKIRLNFNIIFSQLSEKDKKDIMQIYLRTFFVNSLEMEGGTVSYQVAEKLDNKKLRKKPDDVKQSDIILYNNIHKAYEFVNNLNIRSANDFRKIHKIMYQGVYDFAGRYRKTDVTFGVTEDAYTTNYKNIIPELKEKINIFKKNKRIIFSFENILRFHVNYQRVHPFIDGNSRLGRLILLIQLFKLGYPAPVLKKENSHSYRSSLVRAINKKDYTSFFKLNYNIYKRTWNKFFVKILNEKIKNSKKIIFKR